MAAMLLLLPVLFFTTKLAIVVSLFGTNHSIDAFHLPRNAITGTQHYHQQQQHRRRRRRRRVHQDDEKLVRRFVSEENTNEDTTKTNNDDDDDGTSTTNPEKNQTKKSVVIIGAGWGGLSVAHTLSSQSELSLIHI